MGSRLSSGPLRLAAALPVVALLLAGCSGGAGGGGDDGPMGVGNAGGQGNFGSSMETTTVATNASPANTSSPADTPSYACPKVEVRGGAAAWQVTDKADGGIRYQATLGQFSRECRYSSPDMNMRIGIQGRVLLGAKGGPGKLNVPIRLAVVEEGPNPKPVWTKFYSVPVEIGAGVMQVDFGLVADDANFPLPTSDALDRYVVYVGFDSQAGSVAETKPARPKPAQQARPKPVQPAPVAATPAQPRPAQPAPVAVQPAQPVQPRAVPTQAVTPAPATPAPVTSTPAAPAPVVTRPATPAPDDSQTQWIGAPAPATGGFSQ